MQNLIYEKLNNHIGLLKINRPDVLNALNKACLEELYEFLQNKDLRKDCKALILTGSGEKSFIAGADIQEMKNMSPVDIVEFCHLGQKVANALSEAPFLTIAAVNGYALGGGCEMALACDFIYASQKALFGFPEVSLALIPGFGGTQRFARAVGTRLAKEYIMSGRTFSAETAKEIGLVNQVVDSESLITTCMTVASEVTKHSHFAVVQAKRAIDAADNMSLEEGLELEKNIFSACFATQERLDAMSAFLEKRSKR